MSLPNPSTNGTSSPKEPLQPPESAAQDAWSLRVATVSGIPIRLHFTFLLLVTWFAALGHVLLFGAYVNATLMRRSQLENSHLQHS